MLGYDRDKDRRKQDDATTGVCWHNLDTLNPVSQQLADESMTSHSPRAGVRSSAMWAWHASSSDDGARAASAPPRLRLWIWVDYSPIDESG